MEEDITKRRVVTDENGEKYIRYYNDKCKMWMSVYSDPDDHSGTEYITKKLKEIYLERLGIRPQNDDE